jgi:hypothetical protein
MKCQEADCSGKIDWDTFITIRTKCVRFEKAFPCSKCGRLHWVGGAAVFAEDRDRVFLRGRRLVYARRSSGHGPGSRSTSEQSCKIKRGC